MKRRSVLKSVCSGSFGMIGARVPDTTDENSSTFEKNKQGIDPKVTEVQEVPAAELTELKSEITGDIQINQLISEISNRELRVDWSSLRAMRYTIESEEVLGQFDVAVVKFTNQSEFPKNNSLELGGENIGYDRNEIFLHWVGNERVANQELFESQTESTTLAQIIHEEAGGATLVHFKEDEKRNGKSSKGVADEVTLYETKTDDSSSIFSRSTDLEVESTTVTDSGDEFSTNQVGICSVEDEISPQCGGGETGYCLVDVGIYDDLDSCWTKWCLLTSGVAITTAVATCLVSGGILCFIGASVSAGTLFKCMQCEADSEATIEIEKQWVASYELEYAADTDTALDMCGGGSTGDYPGDKGHLPVERCKIGDEVPTKEDFYFPSC